VKRLRRRHAGILLIPIAIMIGLAAGASAYWSGSGTGVAGTVLPNTQALSFAPGVPTAQLFPGGATGVAIVASNPNSFFVHVGSMALDGETEAIRADAAHSGCNVSALDFLTQDNEGNGWQVPPRVATVDGTLTINLPAALTMSGEAASACQGATFSVRVEAVP
jgi:hypothetical protein